MAADGCRCLATSLNATVTVMDETGEVGDSEEVEEDSTVMTAVCYRLFQYISSPRVYHAGRNEGEDDGGKAYALGLKLGRRCGGW